MNRKTGSNDLCGFGKNSHAPKALHGKVRGRFEKEEAVKADTFNIKSGWDSNPWTNLN
jgi:hypothetical protein